MEENTTSLPPQKDTVSEFTITEKMGGLDITNYQDRW